MIASELSIPPVWSKQKASIMYKTVHKLTPVYLQEIFTTRNTNYDLRDAENKLYLAKPRTDYLNRSFCYSGAFSPITLERPTLLEISKGVSISYTL